MPFYTAFGIIFRGFWKTFYPFCRGVCIWTRHDEEEETRQDLTLLGRHWVKRDLVWPYEGQIQYGVDWRGQYKAQCNLMRTRSITVGHEEVEIRHSPNLQERDLSRTRLNRAWPDDDKAQRCVTWRQPDQSRCDPTRIRPNSAWLVRDEWWWDQTRDDRARRKLNTIGLNGNKRVLAVDNGW